jgi:hypothetical protein
VATAGGPDRSGHAAINANRAGESGMSGLAMMFGIVLLITINAARRVSHTGDWFYVAKLLMGLLVLLFIFLNFMRVVSGE